MKVIYTQSSTWVKGFIHFPEGKLCFKSFCHDPKHWFPKVSEGPPIEMLDVIQIGPSDIMLVLQPHFYTILFEYEVVGEKIEIAKADAAYLEFAGLKKMPNDVTVMIEK